MGVRGLGLAVSVFVAAAGLLFSSVPAWAGPQWEFTGSFGPPELLAGIPSGVAVESSSGDVYVAAELAGKVYKFNKQGEEENFSGLGSPQLVLSGGSLLLYQMVVDESGTSSQGDLDIVDLGDKVVSRFDEQGEPAVFSGLGEAQIGGFTEPAAVAVAPAGAPSAGDVFVSDYAEGTVDEFSPTGEGNPLNPVVSGLSKPNGVAVDAQGDLYVAQYSPGLGTVEFVPNGSGGFQPAPQPTIDPAPAADVVVDTTGDVFIDTSTSIKEYDSSGTLLATFGEEALNTSGSNALAVNSTTKTVYAVNQATGLIDTFEAKPVEPPVVKTEPALGVGKTVTTLAGSTNPGGAETEVYFEYGPAPCDPGTARCGTKTKIESLTGRSPQITGARVGKLTPGVTYAYWITATNEKGAVHGNEQTFTTGTEPPNPQPTQAETTPETSTAATPTLPTYPTLTTIHPVPTPTTTTPPPPTTKKKKPPTRAQHLAKALKACHTKPNKHKRAACEKQAKKRYGATTTKGQRG